jgi:hypothetical protein
MTRSLISTSVDNSSGLRSSYPPNPVVALVYLVVRLGALLSRMLKNPEIREWIGNIIRTTPTLGGLARARY